MTTDFDRWAAELAQDTEVAAVNCVCGHPEQQHAHYRNGNDCVVCGCMFYRAPVDRAALAVWAAILTITILWVAALVWMLGVIL